MALVKGNFNVPDFYWFVGVVEGRVDPDQLGRVKVRVMGYHTADKSTLPTKELPWAVPIQPTTGSLMNGIGFSPTNLIEGSVVVGFFADGEDGQQPIIIGSVGGMPFDKSASHFNDNEGFADPSKKYPRSQADVSDYADDSISGTGEPDVSRLARGEAAETHHSLINKKETLTEDVPRAIAQEVVSRDKKDSIQYTRTANDAKSYWSEPAPRFGDKQPDYAASGQDAVNSRYPYNSVRETESGHIFEVDDTPNNERIHTYHKSGTFEEIQADGKRITKVVGEDFEIFLKDKKIFIKGDSDVTIEGTSRIYVKGNVVQEVEGDLVTTVKGDRVTHVEGNDILEVKGDQANLVEGTRGTRVNGKDHETIGGEQKHMVSGNKDTTIGGDSSETVSGEKNQTVMKNLGALAVGGYKVLAGENFELGSGKNFNIAGGGEVAVAATDDVLVAGTNIHLNK